MATVIPGETLELYLLSDRFRAVPHIIWTRQADATVLLDSERGLYYTLNDVASRTWELLVAGEPLIEILRCLGDEYEVGTERLQADVADVIRRLLEAELIERAAV